MAESLLITIASEVLSQIASLFIHETVLAWSLRSDLRKLQNTINNVKAVILDAEEAQLTSHEVSTWLAQLKDVLFDAEDVFNEFAYEAIRKQLANCPIRGGTRKKVRRFFSMSSNPIAYRLRMRQKVRDIREAFDEVAANRAKFHLNTHHNMVHNNSTLLLNQRELTHSFVDASQVIGRDADRDTIVDSLMSHSACVSVVSIVGMGGLGKTALAKMVFNDLKVDDHFEKKVWVCLGDLKEFNVNQVMVKIVKSLTGEKKDESDSEQLQSCLRKELCNKKFLLVLDDVWVVNRAKWLEFKELLKCGASESKVMVSTRDSSVAINMGSSLVHSLNGLPHDQCVSLFKTFAFSEGEDDQNLMKIGDLIVEKCKGVPLAIKTLGCLLFSKKNKTDWEFVRDTDIWKLEQKSDDILPALKISYNQLPFVLKQCFLSCVNFPKDFDFDSTDLIGHWSGCGLLESANRSKNVKDTGEQYINELCARGFFQDFEEYPGFSTFKMHDLFHDLALSFAQSELTSMEANRQGKDIYKRIRHASFSYSRVEGLGGKDVPKLFPRVSNSRSSCLMPAIWSVSFDDIGEESDGIVQLLETCISELEHLRIMDLACAYTLKKLPSSIGALKHLRYLRLLRCESLKRLPDSICKLYSLHTLSLDGCKGIEKLPENIGDLVNLKTLDITTKQERLSEGVGNGIESLSLLQELTLDECVNLRYVFESCQSPLMTCLRTLLISNCKNLTCLMPSTSSVKNPTRVLSALETLFISECPNLNLASMFNDGIRPVRLRWLGLWNLPQMLVCPEWICVKGCAATLEYLAIGGCENMTCLPQSLCNLTSLRRLLIFGCPKLLCMPQGLGALKDLVIAGCPELSQRCKRGIGEDWPNIKHIPKIKLDGEYQ